MNATQQLALFGINPVGAILGGVVAAAIGLQMTLAIAAGGAALTALILAGSPIRRLRAIPATNPARL